MIGALWPVLLGGAVGSAGRHLVTLAVTVAGGPDLVGRMAVNVLGGFLAGLYLARRAAEPARIGSLEPLVAAGFLGGFTTVAGYASDTARALDAGAWTTVLALVAVDGAIGIAAAFLGHRLGRGATRRAH